MLNGYKIYEKLRFIAFINQYIISYFIKVAVIVIFKSLFNAPPLPSDTGDKKHRKNPTVDNTNNNDRTSSKSNFTDYNFLKMLPTQC